MANGNPILVRSYESDIWIGDFPLAHLVGPVVYLDPPFATMRSAQVPLITSVHTFCFCRLETAAHAIEHFLRRRLSAVSQGDGRTGADGYCDKEDAFTREGSLLNSPQKKRGAQKCDHRPSQKNHEIVNIKLRTRAIHVHQPKSAAKMCKRKQLGNVANRLG